MTELQEEIAKKMRGRGIIAATNMMTFEDAIRFDEDYCNYEPHYEFETREGEDE